MPTSDIKTPGVYIQEIPSFPPSVAQVATAIPAFIGYSEKAVLGKDSLTLKPTLITSMLEYESFFGRVPLEEEIVVKVTEVDVNGKKQVVSVVADFAEETVGGITTKKLPKPNNMYYALQAYFSNGGGPCYIVSVGAFGATGKDPVKADLLAGLTALASEDAPTLIVFPEAQRLPSAEDHGELIYAALGQCETLQDRFVITDLFDTGENISNASALVAATDLFRLKVPTNFDRLKYGAAYFPNVRMGLSYRIDEDKVKISGGTHEGKTLSALKPKEGVIGGDGAVYSQATAAISNLPLVLPPSPLIAGVYAQVDRTRGVWKAPANVGLSSVTGVTFKVTDALQQSLNVHETGKSINAIRPFTGQGVMVWGARTLDGNSNEWRYVPVRRFFNMVEESVKKACNRFVFEPNDANTWVKVRAMIENFLLLQWRDGALQGAKPEQAFFVRVGLGVTMIPQDILEGRMNIEIGMAVVRPAEFIILKFSHKMPEA